MYIGNIIFIALTLVSFVGLYKIFEKTGKTPWKALIPFLNFYEWIKLLQRPWWWVFLMIVPGVNILMYAVLTFITAQNFGKRKAGDLLIASFIPFLYLLQLGFSAKEKWIGTEDLKNKKGGFVKNWLDPIIFAVIAASVIRTFFLEAFTIPTSSLEKSLLVGDFLFVNKFAYGAKIPQTPLSFPFAHHTLPATKNTKSYLEWIKLPYFRLPGYSTIKNGDIVVFNYPDGDSVLSNAQDRSYYNVVRQNVIERIDTIFKKRAFNEDVLSSSRYDIMNNPNYGKLIARPIDKRDHYVKRCVAIAGDVLEIKDGQVYINHKEFKTPPKAQFFYEVDTKGMLFGGGSYKGANEKLLDKFDIYIDEAMAFYVNEDSSKYLLNMPADVAEKVKALPDVIRIKRVNKPQKEYDFSIFPHHPNFPWNNDNFGPLTIPKQGVTVPIDTSNICLYDRIIDVYEDNELEIKNGKIYINGIEARRYTFKQDYYWMMGDNRHNSADSRSWGFVPFDHVVGKPVFVWFSMKDAEKNPVSGKGWISSLTKSSKDGKFRWERFFCFVGDKGLSKSYFIHFIIIVVVWTGTARYLKYRKKQKKKEPKTN